MRKVVYLLALGLLVFAPLLKAETLRCGVHLVETGDNKASVQQDCGKPMAIDSYCRNILIAGRYGDEMYCSRVDVWTYNFGIGSFLMNVEFEEGKVTNIYHGDRVN